MGFHVWPTNFNTGNWFVSHEFFTDVCDTSFLSWTWYSCTVQFYWMAHFIYLPWSITPIWNMFMKLPCNTDICVHIWGMYRHLHVIQRCTGKFNCYNKHWKRPFSSRIQTTNNLYAISWCSNTAINYNIICMCQRWD